MIFHVLNRANDRKTIFQDDADYLAFLRVVRKAQAACPIRILAYCVMPNHWHFVLWPEEDGDLSAFMKKLTTTHVRRWQLHRNCVGEGHLYQGPYKPFAIQDDDHFYTACRYVERNALRANLVSRAEEWKWSSLWQRNQSSPPPAYPALTSWPLPEPTTWVQFVNQAETEEELAAIRKSIERGCPFGDSNWQQQTAKQLGLASTLKLPGRPKA